MKPYYEDDSITIFHGDCRDILPSIKSVDLLLTDPPYGLNIANNPFRQKHEKQPWDAVPVDIDLLRQCIDQATFSIIWGGNYFDLPPHQKFFVWDKGQPEKFSSAMCEQAYTTLAGPAKLFRRHVVSYEKFHPTQKPIELMRWCIEQTGNEAQTILDPFMGSGTTLRAAKDLAREAIGIETDERYCEIAAKRMSQMVMEL